MSICLHVYDLNIDKNCFSGCAEFDIGFFKVFPVKHLKLGCFGIDTSQSLRTELENMLDYFKGHPKRNCKDKQKVMILKASMGAYKKAGYVFLTLFLSLSLCSAVYVLYRKYRNRIKYTGTVAYENF